MLKKIKSSLFAKVFLLSAALMMMCCAVTYGCLVMLAPYVYTYNLAAMSELADVMSMEITNIPRDELPYFLEFYNEMLVDESHDECFLRIFRSDGQEVSLVNLNEIRGGKRSDYNDEEIVASTSILLADETDPADLEEFTLVVARNTGKESQVVEALQKAWPLLCVIVLLLSLSVALIFARYITKPLKSLSAVSQSMASLDFDASCPVCGRDDEIGVLGRNLNELSQKLSTALADLREANVQLQADIDKERAIQQQHRYFFSAVSHELKTPVTIVKGQLEGMIHNVGRYKDRDKYLVESLQAVNRLESMVQELLMATRLEAPDGFSHGELLDVGAMLEEQLTLVEDWLVQKTISVHRIITPRTFVKGDRALLREIVDNLLNNALSYSPDGSQVMVALTTSDTTVCLALENTGVHIPEDALPRLCETFYRVDDSRSQSGGTGLGLYLVKTIIDLYGGSISVSNTDEGVLVQVLLPKADEVEVSSEVSEVSQVVPA